MFERTEYTQVAVEPRVEVSLRRSGNIGAAKSLIKRAFDFMAALMALAFLSPILVFVAILIKLDSKGPVFFLQRRSGLNGELFHIYKFRSMTVTDDGDKVVQAKVNDQRVTRVGKILRRTSIDEVPQLINIVRGEMSIVGPRPHALAHDKEFAQTSQRYNDRFRARPGLTGLAQVRGYRGEIQCEQDLLGRIDSDNEYIERWSLALDIATILKTVPLVFKDSNAY